MVKKKKSSILIETQVKKLMTYLVLTPKISSPDSNIQGNKVLTYFYIVGYKAIIQISLALSSLTITIEVVSNLTLMKTVGCASTKMTQLILLR